MCTFVKGSVRQWISSPRLGLGFGLVDRQSGGGWRRGTGDGRARCHHIHVYHMSVLAMRRSMHAPPYLFCKADSGKQDLLLA
eukprot:scaffold8147_cov146-Isochrysis_galbana.AAC.1